MRRPPLEGALSVPLEHDRAAQAALHEAVRAHHELLDAEERFDRVDVGRPPRRRLGARPGRRGGHEQKPGQPPLQGDLTSLVPGTSRAV